MTAKPFRVPRSRAYLTHRALRDDILQALEPMLFDGMGEGHEVRRRLEIDFAAAVRQTDAVAIHSGTMALFVALHACQIASGDEVITVGNSDISTTGAIVNCGAIPVLCDILADDYTIDLAQVERLITPRTRALMPVDLYGHPANIKRLRPLADHYGLKIIEDAALATGAMDDGRAVGTYADICVFSFAPFKPLGSAGNGAMAVTSDPDLGSRLRLLTGYGHASDAVTRAANVLPGHQHYLMQGYNVPLDPLQAALLTLKLPHLPAFTAKRRAIAQAYADGLADTSAILPRFRPESAPTFRAYTIRVPRRDEIYLKLREAGIEVVIHYAPPISQHPVYGGRLRGADALPITDHIAGELLCLPVAPELTLDDVAMVVDALRDLLA